MKKMLLFAAIIACAMNGVFAGTITVTQPAGGSFAMGAICPIHWTAPGVNGNIKIQLINPGGGMIGPLAHGLPAGSSPWSWTVGGPAAAGQKYRIRVSAGNIQGESAVFTVAAGASPPPPGPAPTITVTGPNTPGLSLCLGGNSQITWTAPGVTQKVRLLLAKTNGAVLGKIAENLDAGASPYNWTNGAYIGGTAPAATDYKILVVTMDGAAQDASDFAFELKSCSGSAPSSSLKRPGLNLSKSTTTSPALQPGLQMQNVILSINVTAPEAGKEFEYSGICVGKSGGGRCIGVKCQWTSGNAGPFDFFLHEVGSKKETPLQPVAPVKSDGGQAYSATFTLTEQGTNPGWYKIHVKCPGAGGYSGQFLLKYRLLEVVLKPSIVNKWYFKQCESNALGIEPERPGTIRLGYQRSACFNEWGDIIGCSNRLYRSRVTFDFSQFSNRKGKFKGAMLVITNAFDRQESLKFASLDSTTMVYILAESWPGGNWLAKPGVHIQNFGSHSSHEFDISDWAAAWASGGSPNHGMLFTLDPGTEDLTCREDAISGYFYYKVALKVTFQEEE